jgi:hypothetical protein
MDGEVERHGSNGPEHVLAVKIGQSLVTRTAARYGPETK